MRGFRVFCSAGAVAASAGLAVAQPWLATPLGDLGGEFGATARGVNGSDEVVGYSDTAAGLPRAFYWSAATGIVALPYLEGGIQSRAFAINNAHQIVGTSDDSTSQLRAVMWVRGAGGVWQATDLGTLPGGSSAVANAISDTGYVAGRSGTSAGPSHAFILFNGTMTDLGVLNYPPGLGSSEALGVDNAGHAVGFAYAPLAGPDHAWYYNGTSQVDITPVGQFVFAHANAINSVGQVAGTGAVVGGGSNGLESAIYTVGGSWVELGVVTGYATNEALAINNSGRVVGRMLSDATQTNVAYIYGATPGGMRALGEVSGYGPDLTEATGISNTGAVIANAKNELGFSQALLLKPDPCYVNCDKSTAAPVLNTNDFQCFLNLFAAQNWRANCDLSTSAPVLNTNDFQCFLNKFAAGCS